MLADLEPPAPAPDPPPAQPHEQEEIVEEPLPADPDLEQVPGGSEMDVMAAERKSLGMLMHDQMLVKRMSGKAQEFNQPTSDGEAVLSAVVKDVLEAVGGIAAASRQRHAAEYGGKLDSIFLPANGAKPHLDATARALFLQWIKTKAENAIKQSKSPSSKDADAQQATPVKAIAGKDRRVFVAAATPSGDEVQGEMAAGNMRKLHWSFGAAWNSFGATQQQPIMGNSQLVDGSLDQL
ncbi:hypothetical protein QJQ45_012151 [Haematococcus lacustris]|nr:hypothetical protein QJQ45_012151 [Haematococcus lacustris]